VVGRKWDSLDPVYQREKGNYHKGELKKIRNATDNLSRSSYYRGERLMELGKGKNDPKEKKTGVNGRRKRHEKEPNCEKQGAGEQIQIIPI